MPERRITVFLADDNLIVREGCGLSLAALPTSTLMALTNNCRTRLIGRVPLT